MRVVARRAGMTGARAQNPCPAGDRGAARWAVLPAAVGSTMATEMTRDDDQTMDDSVHKAEAVRALRAECRTSVE
jgi:hypothetical protein